MDELPVDPVEAEREEVGFSDPSIVFVTGNHAEADAVRAMLEGCGIRAEVTSTGPGRWRPYGLASEISGVPSPLNAHAVVVEADRADEAVALIASPTEA